MFGLTRREQRWKAEHQAAELLCDLVKEIVKAAKGQPGGECKSEDLRYQELIMAVSKNTQEKRGTKPHSDTLGGPKS